MKKNVNFIENANVVIKSVAAELRNANKEYTSLSAVLREMKRKDMLKAGYQTVLAAVGVADANTLTPAFLREQCQEEQLVDYTNKKTKQVEKVMAIQGYKLADDGKTRIVVWRRVTSWTPRKVVLILAQSQAIRNAQ